MDDGLLLRFWYGEILSHELINAAQKILHRADLAHVLGLEAVKLLGHVVGVDAFVAGDKMLRLVLLHQLQEA